MPTVLLEHFKTQVSSLLEIFYASLKDAELSGEHFSFYTSVSSVYSSKIEGEEIDLDSYIKHKKFGIAFQPDYTKKIDDLYAAYKFAENNRLGKTSIEQAHQLLSQHFLSSTYQGKLRNQNMYVTTSEGKIEYIACQPMHLVEEMQKFYADLELLLQTPLDLKESFFFAAMIHLVFVKIHPWTDGSGRTARLLEKWFLAEKLGSQAWFLQNEKYYYDHHHAYYKNIRLLGLEYEGLEWGKAMDFLLMLPRSLGE